MTSETVTTHPRDVGRAHTLLEWLCLGLILAACFAVYANGYDHGYNLDSGPGLLENPAVRSLANIPQYFDDPFTLTMYRANVDYRPILQSTFALNHAISGYAMWSWHLLQVLLHCVVTIALYAFSRQLLGLFSPHTSLPARRTIALGIALVHALHPVNAGVVMYLWARSSLLVAALVLPSFVLFVRARCRDRLPIASWVLFGLALFVKLETVGVLAVYLLLEALVKRARHPGIGRASLVRDLLRGCWGRSTVVLTPFLLAAVGYFAHYSSLMPDFAADARQISGMGHLEYMTTQVTAWWHYVYNWIAPLELVADDLTYPHYTSPLNTVVLLAVGGWLLVATLLRAGYARHPQYLLLALAALAVIAPTSSVMPLAEMINEHRPYLPMALLSFVVIAPLGVWLTSTLRRSAGRVTLVLAVCLCLAALAGLTWKRNQVFENDETYWGEILETAPSSRAHLNYGLSLMRSARYGAALEHYQASLELAPYWDITHSNMGLTYQALGDLEAAEWHFDQAVAYARYTSLALEHRGRFYLHVGRYTDAAADFNAALATTMKPFEVRQGLATAYAGLGNAQAAVENTIRCLELDPSRTGRVVERIATPFDGPPTQLAAGIIYLEQVEPLFPDQAWISVRLNTLQISLSEHSSGTALPRSGHAQELLQSRQYRRAGVAFLELVREDPEDFSALQGLATAYAGLGDDEAAFYYTLLCLGLDELAGRGAIVPISTPFFADPALHQAGLRYFLHLEDQIPNEPWVHENQARLLDRMGLHDAAAERRGLDEESEAR